MSYTIGRMSYKTPLKAGKTSTLTVNFSRTSDNIEETFVALMYASKGNKSNFEHLATSKFKLLKNKKSLDVKFYPEFENGGEYYTKIRLYKAKYASGSSVVTTGSEIDSRIGKYPDTVEEYSSSSDEVFGLDQSDISYYNQNDNQWNKAAIKYKNTNKYVSKSGCGPTSLSMAMHTLKSSLDYYDLTPYNLCKEMIQESGQYYGTGASSGSISYVARKHRFNSTSKYKGTNTDDFFNILKNIFENRDVVVLGQKSSYLGNHVVFVYGLEIRNGEKYLRIADPNKNNSHYHNKISSNFIEEDSGFVLFKASYIFSNFRWMNAISY